MKLKSTQAQAEAVHHFFWLSQHHRGALSPYSSIWTRIHELDPAREEDVNKKMMEGWTRWPLKFPSHLKYPMIL